MKSTKQEKIKVIVVNPPTKEESKKAHHPEYSLYRDRAGGNQCRRSLPYREWHKRIGEGAECCPGRMFWYSIFKSNAEFSSHRSFSGTCNRRDLTTGGLYQKQECKEVPA